MKFDFVRLRRVPSLAQMLFDVRIALALMLAFMLTMASPAAVFAQGFPLPNNTPFTGHYITQAPTPPVGTGCTIVAGSTDMDGSCVTSAASGTIVFGAAYVSAPFCTVTDASATSTVSMPVYATTISQITLTTIITAHTLFWHCAAKVGG